LSGQDLKLHSTEKFRLLLEMLEVDTKALDFIRFEKCLAFDEESKTRLWRGINFLANKNRVAGLLYSSLLKLNKTNICPETIANLKLVQEKNATKELLYSGVLLQLRKLRTVNASIWVSGAFLLARCIYPNRGQVAFDYLELFVYKHELEEVTRDLLMLGFAKERRIFLLGDIKVKLMGFSEPLLPGIDVLKPEDIQTHACEYDIGGHYCTGPAPELLLFCMALRVEKDKSWGNLISLVSAKECILHERFNWPNFVRLVKQYNANIAILSLLAVLKTLFNIKIPLGFCSKLSENVPPKLIVEKVDKILLQLVSKKNYQEDRHPSNLGEYVGTPVVVVEKMLEVANIRSDDIVCDLGCGDGRFLISAALKYRCKGFGVDYDEQKILEAKQYALQNKVSSLLDFQYKDLSDANLSRATVIISYLNNSGNASLLAKIRDELPAGTRVLTHQFSFPGIFPDKVITIETGFASYTDIYVWNLWG
jgi:hypothetical protein